MQDWMGMEAIPTGYLGGLYRNDYTEHDEPILSFFCTVPNAMENLPVPKFYKNGERVIPIHGFNCATHFINNTDALIQIKKVEKYDDVFWVSGYDKSLT